jgi:hypothetical protein
VKFKLTHCSGNAGLQCGVIKEFLFSGVRRDYVCSVIKEV